MTMKKTMILKKVITFILGISCLGIGILKSKEQLIYIGAGILVCVILQVIRQWKALSDPEKMKELENVYNDERVIYIARKSYSFAFWVSVYAEFLGVLVTSYLEMSDLYTVLSGIVCFQVFVYAMANIFYSKRC